MSHALDHVGTAWALTPAQLLGVGMTEVLMEAIACLPGQGLIYRYPLPGCQARGKWEQQC